MATSLRFLPWVKSGLATSVTTRDDLSESLSAQSVFPVNFKVNNKQSINVDLALYGPGHITAIDIKEIVRTDPHHGAVNFEPNYFPIIEFRRADFPWLFTPATGDTNQRLRPWLVLLVLKVQDGVSISSDGIRPLPVLTINDPVVLQNELPDLSESWAWAHAQTVTGKTLSLEQSLAPNSPLSVSRLICPVKLRARTRYLACLVPAFEVGRLAGLGMASETTPTLTPAWKTGADATGELQLPVYYKWEFSTGAGGDFESLVRKLKAGPLPQGVGVRKMNVANLGFNLPDLGIMDFASALKPPGMQPGAPPDDSFKQQLRSLLNKTAKPFVDSGEDPVVGPPIYGRYQAAHDSLETDTKPPAWMETLNLDPRQRVIAGLGTLVVQDQQDLLMNSAWEQLADASQTVTMLQRSQLSHHVNLSLYHKHLAKMSDTDLFQVSAPAHKRIVVDPSMMNKSGPDALLTFTLHRTIEQSQLPTSSTSAAFRRLLRPRGPVARRLDKKTGTGAQPIMRQRLFMRMATPLPVAVLDLSGNGLVSYEQVRLQITQLLNLHKLLIFTPNKTLAGKNFLNAALPVLDYMTKTRQLTPPTDARPPLPDFTVMKQVLLNSMDPNVTAPLAFPVKIVDTQTNSSTDQVLDFSTGEPQFRHPVFDQPMYEPLKEISQEYILPGAELIPENTITLLETNPEFIEAYMVGLNHEMSRELLWREYPTNQRGTYFGNFWTRMENLGHTGSLGMRPIHQWKQDLGQHLFADGTEGRLILLIRGELLTRYPGAIIYAVSSEELHQENRTQFYPVFQGQFDPDIVILGFNLVESEARGDGKDTGYYFVIEQPPTEPRFGLDFADSYGLSLEDLDSWAKLTWGHVVDNKESFDAISHLKVTNDRLSSLSGEIDHTRWGLNSAHQARITFQSPVRIAIHANMLLPVSSEQDS